ncbi:MAG: hypothetical protein FWF44_10160 [Defluviitaleaceae bacterium]|nr:hypothetical protein [Defluviitaleaceae bacterium]
MSNEEKILSTLETLVLAVNSLAKGQADLAEGQARLEARFDNLEAKFENLEAKVDNLEEGQSRLHESVSVIELEHGQKLGALFDGYQLLYDVATEIRSDVAVLKGNQDRQDLRIKWIQAGRRETV